MTRNDRELETLRRGLGRLDQAFTQVLAGNPNPGDLVTVAEGEPMRVWFLVGTLVTDLAQLYRFQPQPPSNGSPEGNIKENLRDERSHEYLISCLCVFFDEEVKEVRAALHEWSGAFFDWNQQTPLPEILAADSVFQVVASFWELLIAADLCNANHLLKDSTRTQLIDVWFSLIDSYQDLPAETRKGTAWLARNFSQAVQRNGRDGLESELARMATKLMVHIAFGESPAMSKVLEEVADQLARKADLSPGDRESLLALVRFLQSTCRESSDTDILRIIRGAGTQSEANGVLEPHNALGTKTRINLIPGKGQNPSCCPIVLVVAQKKPRLARLENAMKQLRDHLARCPETRLALIVTATFDSEWFAAEYLSLTEIYEKAGRQFLVLLRGPGRAGLSPVELRQA